MDLSSKIAMGKPAVLQTRVGDFKDLAKTLESKFCHYPLWKIEDKEGFFAEKGPMIRGLVTDATMGADREILSKLRNLEIVSTCSVGVDRVDLALCKERGVVVTNTPDVLTDDTADLAIALLLATMRRVVAGDSFVRDGRWARGLPFPLTCKVSGKRVGFIGLGRIGAAIARRVEAFGCSIGYHNRSMKGGVSYKYYGSVVELAKHSDILILSCGLTKQTIKIVGRDVLDALGPQGYLINVARGPVVDESELVKALVENRLAGAGLDVFENEPYVPKELLTMDNVVLQPHLGSSTEETTQAMADLVVANLEAHFSGNPVLTPVI